VLLELEQRNSAAPQVVLIHRERRMNSKPDRINRSSQETSVWAAGSATLAASPAAAGLVSDPQNSSLRASINPILEWISTGIEIAGVSVIVIAAMSATLAFLYGGLTNVGWTKALRGYRANLGRGILLGLELLVAADIIGTVAITPSYENLGILALIVLIRTFLSFSLEVEIEGRWPWRRAQAETVPQNTPTQRL
jgi:uncharacterized membrane protein